MLNSNHKQRKEYQIKQSAYLIEPIKQSITEVEVGSSSDITKLLDVRMPTCADYMTQNGDTLYVDDEGLLHEDHDNHCFAMGGYDPIYGKGLIMGFDPETGDSTSKPKTPLADYENDLVFGWSATKPEPKFEVMGFDNNEDFFNALTNK